MKQMVTLFGTFFAVVIEKSIVCFLQMEESLGMVMIFTIISSSIEWLGARWEEKKAREEEDIRKKKEILDLEEKVELIWL